MKRVLAIVVSIAILAVALCSANYLLKDRSEHGVKQGLAMYEQPKDSIDVVMLGSSHVHYGINTAKLWEEYGISAYDYSSAEQPLWITYYYLREICKTQHPKVVVLDFFTPAAFQEDYKFTYKYLSDSFNGFKLCRNKLNMMRVSMDDDVSLWDKYFPAFFGYHDRYDKLTDADFAELDYDYTNFKGFTPYFEMCPIRKPNVGDDEILAPSDKSVKYLQKIVDYTKEHGIKLYLTVVPYEIDHEHQEGREQNEIERYNWLQKYVAEQNAAGNDHVMFDYTLTHLDDIGLDFDGGTDICDVSHLNYYGATKFSHYLGMHLRYVYGAELIPDHRGDPYYASWDVHCDEIMDLVKANGYEWR